MIDLEAIKARCEAATLGPWVLARHHAEPTIISLKADVQIARQPSGNSPLLGDAEFITNARTDVPALVAEVERLRAELKRSQSEISRRDAHIYALEQLCMKVQKLVEYGLPVKESHQNQESE